MTADLSVSMDRDGIVVEIETPQRGGWIVGSGWEGAVVLSPDEARAKAFELNDAADAFEAAEYRFPSRSVGGPR